MSAVEEYELEKKARGITDIARGSLLCKADAALAELRRERDEAVTKCRQLAASVESLSQERDRLRRVAEDLQTALLEQALAHDFSIPTLAVRLERYAAHAGEKSGGEVKMLQWSYTGRPK